VEEFNLNGRVLYYLSTLAEKKELKTQENYSLLIKAEKIREEDIVLFLENNCREIYAIGKNSEEIHDYIDDFLCNEKYLKLNILTTWEVDTSFENIAFYFFNVSGSVPPLLFFYSEGDKEVLNRVIEFSAKNWDE